MMPLQPPTTLYTIAPAGYTPAVFLQPAYRIRCKDCGEPVGHSRVYISRMQCDDCCSPKELRLRRGGKW